MRRARLGWLVILVMACGDDDGGSGPADAPGKPADVDHGPCGAIGTACDLACPGDLECVDNVCMQMRGDCGGFAGDPCQDSSLTCAYPSGNSAGICMRADEKACVCAIAPDALDCL
jgi:hypothetical protein